MSQYQPKTSQPCGCKRGLQRDNCPACEGTGWRIDFAAVRRRNSPQLSPAVPMLKWNESTRDWEPLTTAKEVSPC